MNTLLTSCAGGGAVLRPTNTNQSEVNGAAAGLVTDIDDPPPGSGVGSEAIDSEPLTESGVEGAIEATPEVYPPSDIVLVPANRQQIETLQEMSEQPDLTIETAYLGDETLINGHSVMPVQIFGSMPVSLPISGTDGQPHSNVLVNGPMESTALVIDGELRLVRLATAASDTSTAQRNIRAVREINPVISQDGSNIEFVDTGDVIASGYVISKDGTRPYWANLEFMGQPITESASETAGFLLRDPWVLSDNGESTTEWLQRPWAVTTLPLNDTSPISGIVGTQVDHGVILNVLRNDTVRSGSPDRLVLASDGNGGLYLVPEQVALSYNPADKSDGRGIVARRQAQSSDYQLTIVQKEEDRTLFADKYGRQIEVWRDGDAYFSDNGGQLWTEIQGGVPQELFVEQGDAPPAGEEEEIAAQAVTLEGEARQEVLDNIPLSNLWIPDGDQMRLLNVENVVFQQTDGDKFIHGYENGRLVLLTERSTARPEWNTYGVSSVQQGRVFENIITAYQLNTPDDCPTIAPGGCRTYPPTIFNFLDTVQRISINADNDIPKYVLGWKELTPWEQSASTPSEILEATIIRGMIEQFGLDATETINSLTAGQQVTITSEGEIVEIDSSTDLMLIMQEPATITTGVGTNSTSLNFGHTFTDNEIVVRFGRLEQSLGDGVYDKGNNIDFDAISPFILEIGRGSDGYYRLGALLWGINDGNHINNLFDAAGYDINTGAYKP